MTNIIRFPHQKLKLKRGHLKRKLKTITVFLSPPATPTNFTKNLPQTPACKSRGKYKEQAKTDKFKKMGSSKIKENHNREKPRKMKETAKRHSRGDQGSPSGKKNIKCQDKEPENVFEDHLTEPNEYSKGYHMYRKIHIPDRFKDPREARRRLNISWNELSEAEVSMVESMVEENNENSCICLHSPSSNRIVCSDLCDIWYHIECIELDHTFAHNTAVYVSHLCIKKTFSGILQYLRYNIDCFLNNNFEDPAVALLNNFALLSKEEIRSFTLLTFSIYYFKKITQKICIFIIEPQTCRWITKRYNNCHMSASIQLLLGSCIYNFLPAQNSAYSELLENLNVVHKKNIQSKNGAIPFDFKMKLGSSSLKRSVLGEILLYFTAVDYSEKLLWAIIYKMFQQNSIFCPFESILIDLSRCVKCGSITGNSRKENHLRVAVFAMSQPTNLKSLLWGQCFCNLLTKSKSCCDDPVIHS